MGLQDIIINNPYRVLGVYSNSSLKERVDNQHRLNANAIAKKEVSFPKDFINIIPKIPIRTTESITAATAAINLDKDRLKYALFWFVEGTPMDGIALKHLQTGNRDKANEIFQKKETFSSLINTGILAFIDGDNVTGFANISKVIHNSAYRAEMLQALGISNLQITEDELAEIIIAELLKEIPAGKLLASCLNSSDRAIISKSALDEAISKINAAVATAKNADSKNPEASLAAGTKLMNSTKSSLKAVKDIAGATSPQYQMVADNVAKQVLQCGINYYIYALETDVDSPRKAMVLQSYALSIAVGQFIKDRCKKNVDIIKRVVPPAEVAVEARKVKEELKKFCNLPDKISYSVTLLNNTKPLLQAIKSKLRADNSFYLSLSTQVVGNALHNVIEEVNQAQNNLFSSDIVSVIIKARNATLLMDSFDMEYKFKVERYDPNRSTLKKICDNLGISGTEGDGVSNMAIFYLISFVIVMLSIIIFLL